MKLNYVVEGDGEAIVLVHGLSDSLLYWEVLTNSLKDDFKVVRYDLRGHGKSQLGSDEITVDLYADDLKNLLDELNLSKVNLVGFSLGGCIALDFAIRYPSYVSSIVLMSSFAGQSQNVLNILNEFSNALDAGFDEFYDLILPMVLCPSVIEENKDELDLIKSFQAQSANVDAFKKAVDALLHFDVLDDLEDIEVPVLVLGGKYDEISLIDEQMEMSKRIKDSRFVVLDNLKHNLLVGKNIGVVVDALNDFYKK